MTGRAEERGAAPGGAFEPFREMVRLTVAAQQRSLDLAQAWTESLVGLLREQVEGNRAVFEALSSSLRAMEQALASQEATNRALRQSLDANREVIERASAAQEHGARLVQTALESLAAASQAQVDAARALLGPLQSAGAGPEPFAELLQSWNAAFQRLLDLGGAAGGRER